MATAHVRQLKQEQQELENRKSELLKEQASKETEIAELEVRRIEKQKALDAESGSAKKPTSSAKDNMPRLSVKTNSCRQRLKPPTVSATKRKDRLQRSRLRLLNSQFSQNRKPFLSLRRKRLNTGLR